jgi:hypothetical protein
MGVKRADRRMPLHLRPAGLDAARTFDDASGTEASSTMKWGVRPFRRHPIPQQESRSMIRRARLPGMGNDVDERSMRLVEYALAFVAVLVAGVLAFVR